MQRIAIAMCFVSACAAPTTPERSGWHLAGVVVDRATGLPVPGAQITAPGSWRPATSGPTGEFVLEVTSAAREIRVSAPGYDEVRRVGLDRLGSEAVVVGMYPDTLDAETEQRLMAARQRIPEDSSMLRAEARQIEADIETYDGDLPRWVAPRAALLPPPSIRVWRRGLDGSTDSCAGRVDVIPFEDYVKGVLPHEWLLSWDPKALEMGAVAIRTYAWFWVQRGGRYDCADICDTARSQVYEDERFAKSDAAVDATRGMAIVKDGAIVVAEYSAENGDPTAWGVDEPHCTGRAVFGHGRGACQWGTQRWAVNEGKDYVWMTAHYYPGAGVARAGWAASFAGESFPAEVTAGDVIEVHLEYRNEGMEAWQPGQVRVATSEPRERTSPFFRAGEWLDAAHPATVAAPVATGQPARFTFRMQAPEVTAPTMFVENFALVGPDGWFGPEDARVSWSIKVNPRRGGEMMDDEAQLVETEVGGGCQVAPGRRRRPDFARLGLFLLLGAAVARRGRRWIVVKT